MRAFKKISFFSFFIIFMLVPSKSMIALNSEHFDKALPEQVGMSSERLENAVRMVKNWVDTNQIIGAAMLVIRHKKIVLYEAVGWRDKEKNLPMEIDTICQMRSMTKPLIGTAVLMLMEEGRLQLEDRVSRYIPAFDNPKSKDITIFQLLTHTSGIKGEIYSREGTKYTNLKEAVDDIGRMGPSFNPGTDYHYSDPGSSTLGALISEISGVPVDEFIQMRILDPLQMKDSFCSLKSLKSDDSRRSRIAATYEGGPGKWKKYWDNSQPEVVPFFRASGGLYSTAMDYANFMAMILNGGHLGKTVLLSPKSIKLATSPHSSYVYNSAQLAKTYSFYGLHWFVYTDKYCSIRAPVSSGTFYHGGSDGTFAWADPKEELIGIYLTQSRKNETRPLFLNLIQAAIDN